MAAPVFPAWEPVAWLDTPGLGESGLALKPATARDLPFLRELYAESRAHELARLAWPQAAMRAFCDSQFDLQHRHYVGHYVPAAFLVVLHADRPVGRLYLHNAPLELRIVDLLLAASVRGRGIGSALLRWTQAATRAAGDGMLSLHVGLNNEGACRLYRRLGFVEEAVQGGHLRMVWRPPS